MYSHFIGPRRGKNVKITEEAAQSPAIRWLSGGLSSDLMPHELASYAAQPALSRGRLRPEEESAMRGVFQRDRDRIIHSTAFRRLKHKTQVFIATAGDLYRTRLTHSLEVAQIARTISRLLSLNEDLTEALALAHDLGHTPFGHAGERMLNDCMAPYGGFDHNAQGLRIVTRLERRYGDFDGLNLTWETLEGLIKHNGPLVDAEGAPCGAYEGRSIPPTILDVAESLGIALDGYAGAEAQVAALSDDIAYNAHDMDDGLRAGLFDIDDLGDVPLAGEALAEVRDRYSRLEPPRLIHETVRRMISWMVGDVVTQSRERLANSAAQTIDDIRVLSDRVVNFSAEFATKNQALKTVLAERMYCHKRVEAIMRDAQHVIHDLFAAYLADPSQLPQEWQRDIGGLGKEKYARRVCDFIAGMTDRYALGDHRRLSLASAATGREAGANAAGPAHRAGASGHL